ncbi:hypothetical protein G6F65_018464 [Rhizopus arrhizus]|nr:hypothetical protein G6F65_018464 [Rhizopus arrhizus]
MQSVVNIALGASLSTVILTVPAMEAMGLFSGQRIVLAMTPVQTLMMLATLLVAAINLNDAQPCDGRLPLCAEGGQASAIQPDRPDSGFAARTSTPVTLALLILPRPNLRNVAFLLRSVLRVAVTRLRFAGSVVGGRSGVAWFGFHGFFPVGCDSAVCARGGREVLLRHVAAGSFPPTPAIRIRLSTSCTPAHASVQSSMRCLLRRSRTVPSSVTHPSTTATDTSLTSRPLCARCSHTFSRTRSSDRV